MIRILINTIAFDPNRWTAEKIPHYKLADLLQPILEAGFHFLEVWQYHISTEDEDSVREIQQLGDGLGLSFPVIGAYPKLHLQGDERDREWEQFARIVDYATILGADKIKLFVGTKGTADLDERDFSRSVEFLGQILEQGEKNGLMITGELHKKTLLDSTAAAQKLIRDIGASNFHICFQPYDFQSTTRALDDMALFGERIKHVHYQGRRDKEIDLLSASDIDYAAVTDALIQQGFRGDMSIEFVKGSVVDQPDRFNLAVAMEHARKDRVYLEDLLEQRNVTFRS